MIFYVTFSKHQILFMSSMKNNQMGDEGVRLIRSALSTVVSANKKILALNLSFNSMGDEGAKHIAQV